MKQLIQNNFFASLDTWFYEYKLHRICTVSGAFHPIDNTKAYVNDIQTLRDVKNQLSHYLQLEDRKYLSSTQHLVLFQTANIVLETPSRINQKRYKLQPYVFRKSRKRIENLFSQVWNQFKTRKLAKITALTLMQYINKFIFDRPINNIKIQIY